MNRPTLDVNDLLEMADEAIEAGDYSHAVSILRKATTVAPLRKDIRNRLAIALEGTPVPKRSSGRIPVIESTPEVEALTFSDNPSDYNQFSAEDDGGGREAISVIAKKAFEAAAGQTARAGVATRNLTNLLQQGLKTWKSSLADQVKQLEPTVTNTTQSYSDPDPVMRVSDAMHSGVFGPEKELEDYLSRAEPILAQHPVTLNEIEFDDEQEPTFQDEIEPVPSISTRKKSTRAPSGRKTGPRQTDVEDVLAAGIDSFIEAVGNADKKKFVFGTVYFALTALFAYACFDVSRKFPEVETIPGQQVQAASLGSLNLGDVVAHGEALNESKALLADGKLAEAADLLRKQLESGKLLNNRDQIRVELASVLNMLAEKHLTNNKLADSVVVYREALKILPDDAALQLRLANALYYLGTFGESGEDAQKAALADAEKVLKTLGLKAGDDLQTHRLLALVQEARGEKNQAKASWQKVKALAPINSAESKEAASHLK